MKMASQDDLASQLKTERAQFRDALVEGSNYSFTFDLTSGVIESDFTIKSLGPVSKILNVKFPCDYDMLTQKIFALFDIDVCENRNYAFWHAYANPALKKSMVPSVSQADLLREYKNGRRRLEIEVHNKSLRRYIKITILMCKSTAKHVMAALIAYDVTESRLEEIRRHEDILRANEYLHNQMRIIRSFSSIYFATWNVDLQKNMISPIAIPAWLDCVASDVKGNAKKALVYFAERFMTKDLISRQKMLDFLNTETISTRLGQDNSLSIEYYGDTFGWVSANIIAVSRDEYGKCSQAIFALRNIDSAKQKELASDAALKEAMIVSEKANKAKTTFLSRMSHDIRTPMNAIIGLTQLALVHIDGERSVLKDYIEKISVSSHHLLELINEVLDMSRIESGRIQLATAPFDISKLVSDTLVIIIPLVKEKNHKFDFHTDIVHKDVLGDALRLQRVIVNIIGNAVKYTPAGGKIVASIKERKTNSDDTACFEFVVKDNGIGMSPDFVKHIFEPFTRAETKTPGTGLGMSIVKSIVTMMNGDIKVDSALGAGSTFTATVYFQIDESQHAAQNDPQSDTSTISEISDLKDSFAGKQLLLVEDNELNSEIASEILKMFGVQIDIADDGKEAVNKFSSSAVGYYSLIFMDIQMPELDGYEATKKIRALPRKDATTIPIIAMTANAFAEDVVACRNAGMNDHISKPLEIKTLKKVLATYLK